MNQVEELLLSSKDLKNKINKISKNISHTNLVVHENIEYANAFVRLLIADIECSNNDVCLSCSNCLKVLNRTAIDIYEYPKKASLIVDEVDEIIDTLNLVPADLSNKYYIINNIENSNVVAQNKLLKSLEEPPKTVKFFLTCSNIREVLPTIYSRAEKIFLPSFNDVDFSLIKKDADENLFNFAKDLAKQDVGSFLKYLNNFNYYKAYTLMIELVGNLNSTLDMLSYSSKIIEEKEMQLEIFEMLAIILRDMLAIKMGASQTVINKRDIKLLKEYSEKFGKIALVKIIDKCLELKEKIKFNANINGVVDDFLLNYLEVKNTCKQ